MLLLSKQLHIQYSLICKRSFFHSEVLLLAFRAESATIKKKIALFNESVLIFSPCLRGWSAQPCWVTADLRCALVDTLHCILPCCFDDETELRPSPHLPPLLFRNLFMAFFQFIRLGFFFIVSSTFVACLQTLIFGTYFWRPFVYFFALTPQYFLFTFFTAPQFHWVFFYLSLALGRNSPQPQHSD